MLAPVASSEWIFLAMDLCWRRKCVALRYISVLFLIGAGLFCEIVTVGSPTKTNGAQWTGSAKGRFQASLDISHHHNKYFSGQFDQLTMDRLRRGSARCYSGLPELVLQAADYEGYLLTLTPR